MHWWKLDCRDLTLHPNDLWPKRRGTWGVLLAESDEWVHQSVQRRNQRRKPVGCRCRRLLRSQPSSYNLRSATRLGGREKLYRRHRLRQRNGRTLQDSRPQSQPLHDSLRLECAMPSERTGQHLLQHRQWLLQMSTPPEALIPSRL